MKDNKITQVDVEQWVENQLNTPMNWWWLSFSQMTPNHKQLGVVLIQGTNVWHARHLARQRGLDPCKREDDQVYAQEMADGFNPGGFGNKLLKIAEVKQLVRLMKSGQLVRIRSGEDLDDYVRAIRPAPREAVRIKTKAVVDSTKPKPRTKRKE